MRSIPFLAILLALGAVAAGGPAQAASGELACTSFEGAFNRCPLPGADQMHVDLKQKLGNDACQRDKSWGADSEGIWVSDSCSAVFSYRPRHGNHKQKGDAGKSGAAAPVPAGQASCPSDLKGNECAYYQDGYQAGAQDGSAGMSMAHERHADAYDSRFEPYFARGYEAGWKAHR